MDSCKTKHVGATTGFWCPRTPKHTVWQDWRVRSQLLYPLSYLAPQLKLASVLSLKVGLLQLSDELLDGLQILSIKKRILKQWTIFEAPQTRTIHPVTENEQM